MFSPGDGRLLRGRLISATEWAFGGGRMPSAAIVSGTDHAALPPTRLLPVSLRRLRSPGCIPWVVRRRPVIVVLLLAVHAALVGWQAVADSPTVDEVGHFAAGLEHWRHWKFDLYRVNPPLTRLVALAPVVSRVPTSDADAYLSGRVTAPRPEFRAGRVLAHELGARYCGLVVAARISGVGLAVLGGWLCYRWAAVVWGGSAGLLALGMWVFCPSIVGYGHLLTPDMGAAALGLAAAFTLRRWLARPSWGRAVAAGTVLGLAELTKTVWLVAFGLWPVLWILYRLLDGTRPRLKRWSA